MAADEHEAEVAGLRRRLEEAEETLRAIRSGEVDALVVSGADGERIFTLQGADHPYRSLIESMQQGAVTLSDRGTVLYCNRRFAEMVGRPQERVIGASAADFVPATLRPSFKALLARGRALGSQGELQFEAPDGSPLPIYLAISPLPLSDVVALCMVVTDLTEQKEHQGLLEVNRRKDEFLAMLAHELRNPLAPIRNALQIMRLAGDDRRALEESRTLMERQVTHMVRLIDDLLDVSRITRGKLELRRGRVELSAVIQAAVDTSRPLVEAADHELTLTVPARPIYVDADLTRLAQVLSNLLNNAAKYTEPGGEIALVVERQGVEVVATVRDSGVGIAPEMLPYVFDMFTQADRSLERSQGGLGIGLTLVRSLVELHGGSVEARSGGYGLGSEFVVRLPIVVASPAVASPPPGGGDGAAGPPSGRRILVVDDNLDSARTLARLLELMGNESRTAHDGGEAVAAAEAYRPDVILLDIGLPVMNGYDVARTIRGRPWGPAVVIVALTGWGQEGDRRRSKEAGIDHHLVKPVDPDALVEMLSGMPTAPARVSP